MRPLFPCGAAFLLLLDINPLIAATETVIYDFPSGGQAFGQLQKDNDKNLYGTDNAGGQYGTVYRLKQHHGVWRADTVWSFNNADGADPVAGLAFDQADEVFYGATRRGGAHRRGTVFSLIKDGSGWNETVLHSFQQKDGEYPETVITRVRTSGLLFGTTFSGGAHGCGTAFQLDTQGAFSVLHDFVSGSDGCHPNVQLREGRKPGTLIGGTTGGRGQGTLYALTQKAGIWSMSVIHEFAGSDGGMPTDLTVLSNDNTSFFGVTRNGGTSGSGVAFQLTSRKHGWDYQVIYNFTGGVDGRNPVGLRLDGFTGALYGTTYSGGSAGRGVVFKLTPNGSGWTQSVLHSFTGGSSDGSNPYARPAIDTQTGQLYGATLYGGASNSGVVYQITP